MGEPYVTEREIINELASKIAALTRENEAMRKALEDIRQRCNESGTGEMGLLDTIHAVAHMARNATALKELADAKS